jgi:hypothetical protein
MYERDVREAIDKALGDVPATNIAPEADPDNQSYTTTFWGDKRQLIITTGRRYQELPGGSDPDTAEPYRSNPDLFASHQLSDEVVAYTRIPGPDGSRDGLAYVFSDDGYSSIIALAQSNGYPVPGDPQELVVGVASALFPPTKPA